MKKLLLFLSLLIPILSIAQESDRWKQMGLTASNDLFYADTQTKTKDSIWIKYLVQPKKTDKVHSIIINYKVNCDNRTMWRESETYYDKNGSAIPMRIIPDFPSPVVPDTAGEQIFNEICYY